jgi:glycosyltransferase involved in cell wall biosynthesis
VNADGAKPFVSVIIPVFNDSERLKLCLRALEHQTYPRASYEVIVVDNGSYESIEPLAEVFEQVRIVHESQVGSYAARNKGISVCRGGVLAFTDSDCVPAKDWIERGVAALRLVPDCGLVAGRIDVFFAEGGRPTAVELYESITAFAQKRYVEQSNFGATANLFTLRSVFESVGLFDAGLRSGGDKDWGQRVYAAGYRLLYADDARVSHPARRSFGQLGKKVARLTGADFRSKRNERRGFSSLLPPARSLLFVLRHERLGFPGGRLKVALVVLFVWYAQIRERLRLKLGGEPRR